MSKRDELRSGILSSNEAFKSAIVVHDGFEYEVRQPTVAGRRKVFNKAKGSDGVVDGFDFMLWSVIYNTYVPGTKELVFEESDYDTLSNRPAGGILDKLGEEAAKLLNAEEDIEKK